MPERRISGEGSMFGGLFTTSSIDTRPHACGGDACQVCRLDRERGWISDSGVPDARKLARTGDPGTSKAAAAALQRESMLRALLNEFARADLTAEEAARRASLDPWAASKRVSDLLNAGHIEPVYEDDTAVTRPGTSGRQQRVLRITMRGGDALFKAE